MKTVGYNFDIVSNTLTASAAFLKKASDEVGCFYGDNHIIDRVKLEIWATP